MGNDEPSGTLALREASPMCGEADCEAAVQASLDSALEDLFRAAIANPVESDAATCARIDEVFDRRMMAHQHLAWAQAEAAALKRRLKAGLKR